MINTIAIVGGTHGNETSGIQLVRNWQKYGVPSEFNAMSIELLLANQVAITENVRFIEQDLNRQFSYENLANICDVKEAHLARNINQQLGPKGASHTDLVIDIHNTTSSMGATLIILETDEFNVGMARYVKQHMPEANILVEDEKPISEHAYLCTVGKRGVMVEVGAQPQGVMRADVYRLAETMTKHILAYVQLVNENKVPALSECEAFRFEEIIYFPRDEEGLRTAMVHPHLQDKDFQPLNPGEPIFTDFSGKDIAYEGTAVTYPHFINEAAYHKLDVAFSTAEKFML